MNKNTVVLYEAVNHVYTVDSPVQLVKYQILRKTNAEETFARLVFGKKSSMNVRSVTFDLSAFDASGACLAELPDQRVTSHLPLRLFDGKALFSIPANATALRITIKQILFAGGKTFRPTPIATQTISHEKHITKGEYAFELSECLTDAGARTRFDYQDYGKQWMCSCGMLNGDRETCALCNAKRSDIAKAFDPETLEERRRSDTYTQAVKSAAETHRIPVVDKSIESLRRLGEYKDSPKQIEVCEKHIKDIKKAWKIFAVIMAVILVSISALLIWLAAEDKKVEALYLRQDGTATGYSFSVSTTDTRGQDEIVIPASYKGTPITTVADRAFAKTNLTVVTLPATISYVGDGAFSDCTVKAVYYKGTLADWCKINFRSATANPVYCGATVHFESGSLIENGELLLPEGVTEIGDYAFYGWSNIRTVRNLDKVTTIGSHSFGATALESADISSVKRLGSGAFEKTQLTELTIPDELTWIGLYCLPDSLQKLSLPYLASSATDTTGLSLSSLFPSSYSYTNTELVDLTIRGGTLKENALKGFQALKKVSLPSNLTVIPDNAFEGCSSLTEVALPDMVTTIGDYAFRNCRALARVLTPVSLSSIGYGVFNGSDKATLLYKGTAAEWKGVTVGKNNDRLKEDVALYSETEPTVSDTPLWHYNEEGAAVKYDLQKVVIDDGAKAADCVTATIQTTGYYTSDYYAFYPLSSGKLTVTSLTNQTGIYAYLYDDAKTKLTASESYGYFSFTYNVTSGKTYYLVVKNSSTYSSYTKLAVKAELSGVQLRVSGGSPVTRYYKKGETVTPGEPKARDGYSFLGWYANGYKMSGDSLSVTKDYQITAYWHKLKDVTLTYVENEYVHKKKAVKTVSRGYTLLRTTKNGNITIDIAPTSSYFSSITLYAADKNTAISTANSTRASGYYSYSSRYSATLPSYLSANTDYYLYCFDSLSATITGNADFITVSGTKTSSSVKTEGSTIKLPTPTRTGYTFTGWKANGKSVDGDAYVVPADDVTLTAVWQAPRSLTLIYNNGSASFENTSVSESKGVNSGEVQFKALADGYAVVSSNSYEHKSKSSYSGYEIKESTKTVTPVSVSGDGYSVLIEVKAGKTYSVTSTSKYDTLTLAGDAFPYFVCSDSTESNRILVAAGSTYALPTPEKAGYSFLGWYVDYGEGGIGGKVDNEYVVPDEDVTLIAMWPKDVTITYNYGPREQTSGRTSTIYSTPRLFKVKDGGDVTFSIQKYSTYASGYISIYDENMDSLGLISVSDYKSVITATRTLSAGTYYLTYSYANGSMYVTLTGTTLAYYPYEQDLIKSTPAIEGTLVDLPTDTDLEGYTFDGWYIDLGDGAIGNKIEDGYVVPDENITLIAKYSALS